MTARVAQRLRQSPGLLRARRSSSRRRRSGSGPRSSAAAPLQRTAARHRERRHKRGSMRFGLLVLILLATAVLVTVAMFQTLYFVMG